MSAGRSIKSLSLLLWLSSHLQQLQCQQLSGISWFYRHHRYCSSLLSGVEVCQRQQPALLLCRRRQQQRSHATMTYPSGLTSYASYKLVDLDRSRRAVTRRQSRLISTIFPFLSLPAEIRNIIYDLCISFNSIENFFDTYYKRLSKARYPNGIAVPNHPVRAPAILLINRQIYAEAIVLLGKKTVRFDHGLLDIKGIREVISEEALHRISTLHITTKGHPMLKKNILRESWIGYMHLFQELADVLSKRHRLKKLIVDLTDKTLAEHTEKCWDGQIQCDYRDQLKYALSALRNIRGVGKVEIIGLDAVYASELKARIESNPKPFMSLPGEVRNMIYHHAADWSDISGQLAVTLKRWDNTNPVPPYPRRSTPTILLLNKTITQEASAILAKKPLNLILPSRKFEREAVVPNILCLITAATLSKIQHLNITVESWEWMFSLGQFLPALAKTHNLRAFRFAFNDLLKKEFLKVGDYRYPDNTIHASLKQLTMVRGVQKVYITGDLPVVYSAPLARIMMSPPAETALPVLKAICGNGNVLDADTPQDA